VKPDPSDDDGLLQRINHELTERFGIGHATIQFERENLQQCPDNREKSDD
jgi:Co/Zn/Cd efflux system component